MSTEDRALQEKDMKLLEELNPAKRGKGAAGPTKKGAMKGKGAEEAMAVDVDKEGAEGTKDKGDGADGADGEENDGGTIEELQRQLEAAKMALEAEKAARRGREAERDPEKGSQGGGRAVSAGAF